MRSGGWKPFWAALFASLLVLVPLVGGTVLLSRQQLRTQLRQAARSESGVPIQLPKTTDQRTVLLCVSGEQPGFVLAYLIASQNCVHLLAVPAGLQVTFADEDAALSLPAGSPQAANSGSASAQRRIKRMHFFMSVYSVPFLAVAKMAEQAGPAPDQPATETGSAPLGAPARPPPAGLVS